MTREQIIKYAPLLLAVYVSTATILFLGCVRRFVTTQRRFDIMQALYWWLSALPSLLFLQWCARELHFLSKQSMSADECVHLLTIVLLGYGMPFNGVFGFVANQYPDAWQQYKALARKGEEANRIATERMRAWRFPRRKDKED